MTDLINSPWMTLAEAGAYSKRGRRFLRREIDAGRLRAAQVGGRREYLTRRDWIDQWLEDLAKPVMVRRAR
jgi:excisionase family DNA binding protein